MRLGRPRFKYGRTLNHRLRSFDLIVKTLSTLKDFFYLKEYHNQQINQYEIQCGVGRAVALVWLKVSVWTCTLTLLWWWGFKLKEGEYRGTKYEDLAHHFLAKWMFCRGIDYGVVEPENSFAVLFTGTQFSYMLPFGI